MNRLKIYLRTDGNIDEQASTYAHVFNGKVLKRSFIDQTAIDHSGARDDVRYAYVEIADNLKLMISKHNEKMPQRGYFSDIVISYDNVEQFEDAYSKLIQHESFKIDFDKVHKPFGGGVVIAKFYDQWGYGWIIERKKPID